MITTLILTALISFAVGVLFTVLLAALRSGRRPAPELQRSSRGVDDGLGCVVPLNTIPRCRHRIRYNFVRAITHGGAAPRH